MASEGATRARGRGPEPEAAHLDEIARILALGILRLQARARYSADSGVDPESDLEVDFSPDRSVHADG